MLSNFSMRVGFMELYHFTIDPVVVGHNDQIPTVELCFEWNKNSNISKGTECKAHSIENTQPKLFK